MLLWPHEIGGQLSLRDSSDPIEAEGKSDNYI